MLDTDPSFRPVRVREGYPPLEDLGLIGDGATVALASGVTLTRALASIGGSAGATGASA